MEISKDRRKWLVSLAIKKYGNEVWMSLTKEQKALVIESFDDQEKLKGGCYGTDAVQHSTSPMSIVKGTDKQEPDSKALVYGDNKQPEFPDKPKEVNHDSREDRVCDCLDIDISPEQRKQLRKLLRTFSDETKRTYDNEAIIRFAYLILDSKNPKMEIETYLRAAGINVNVSGEKLAKQYEVTRQAISKKVQNKKLKLGLPTETRDTKRAETRIEYEESNANTGHL